MSMIHPSSPSSASRDFYRAKGLLVVVAVARRTGAERNRRLDARIGKLLPRNRQHLAAHGFCGDRARGIMTSRLPLNSFARQEDWFCPRSRFAIGSAPPGCPARAIKNSPAKPTHAAPASLAPLACPAKPTRRCPDAAQTPPHTPALPTVPPGTRCPRARPA